MIRTGKTHMSLSSVMCVFIERSSFQIESIFQFICDGQETRLRLNFHHASAPVGISKTWPWNVFRRHPDGLAVVRGINNCR
jgi:hypothetical protein